MNKRNMKMRIAGSLLALSMLATTPAEVFAETYEKDGQIYTTDWSEKFRKKEEGEKDVWPLSQNNRLVRVSPADPVRSPDINYVGVYTNAQGREVVRLSFSMYVASANQWDKLLLKLPKAFDDMVDYQNPFSGIYQGTSDYGSHDWVDIKNLGEEYSESKAQFEGISWDKAGGQHVYSFDLYKNGSMVPGTQELPIDFVLKEGQTIESLKSDCLIQARMTDKDYARVYTRAGERTNDYMQYTMTTIIPKNKNFDLHVNTDLSRMSTGNIAYSYNKFLSTVSSVKFNIEKGYLEVYHRQMKAATGGGYALRQSVDSNFYKLLDERNGMVGEVYLLGADANLYSGYGDRNTYEPNNGSKIQFAKSDINNDLGNGIGLIQIAGSEWDNSEEYKQGIKTKRSSNVRSTDAILGTAPSDANAGIYTVVRYFIKPEQLEKLIKENGLKSYTFKTSIIRQNETKYGTGKRVKGITEYDFTSDKERVLHKGTKIKLKFDKAQYSAASTGGSITISPQIIIGDANYNIALKDSALFDSKGFEATWTVPFDIKIKKGEKIKVKSIDWDEKNRATKLAMYFGDNDFQEVSPKVNYDPIEMSKSDSITGGALTSTLEKPNVNEIFTSDKAITGHSFHEGAEINISIPGVKKQTISAVAPDKQKDDFDYSTIMTPAKKVNGENDLAFPFSTKSPNAGGYVQADKKYPEFKMPELVKDMRVKVDNLATLSSFIPSDSVDEKVQAKVKFDLNGGSLDNNVVSFEGYDEDIKSSELYKVARQDAKGPVTRIVPMNKKYADEDGYKVNGFVGEDASDKDHDGIKLDGNALKLRKFVDEVPTVKGTVFLGWTTQPLKGSPEENTKAFSKLTEADTADKVNSGDNYIFTKTSPVTKDITVYAAYGSPIIRFHTNPPTETGKEDEVINQSLTEENINYKDVTLQENYDNPKFKIKNYALVGYSTKPDAEEPDRNVTGKKGDLNYDEYLRDGDKMPLTQEQLEKGLDLYAIWRPYHKVILERKWSPAELKDKNIDKIYVGLLSRTAVGVAGHEVVHNQAVYRPVEGSIQAVSSATPKKGDFHWYNLPSYDKIGRRISYIAVELTESTKKLFEEGSTDYAKYGITMDYDGFGSKNQLLNKDGVDAMSAATERKHIDWTKRGAVEPSEVKGYFDTYGYYITLKNTKVNVQPPTIDPIKYDHTQVVVRKVGDPSKIVINLPKPLNKKVTIVKNEQNKLVVDSANTDFDGNVNIDDQGVITLTTGKLTADEIVKAQQFKTVAGVETGSEIAEQKVEGQPISHKVLEYEQKPKDENGDAVVEFLVPWSPILPPKEGSKYTIGYEENGVFVPVGNKSYILDHDINSDKPENRKGSFTIPKDKLVGIADKKLIIKSEEKDKKPSKSEEFKLDLTAPTADAKPVEDLWRRWVDLDLSNFVEESQRIIVKYVDMNGATQILRLDTAPEATGTVNMLNRQGYKDLEITLEDRFGNTSQVKPEYNPSTLTDILLSRLRKGKNYVMVKTTDPNTLVTVRVYKAEHANKVMNNINYYNDDGAKVFALASKVAQQEIAQPGTRPTKISLGDYKLEAGDIVEVVGTTDNGSNNRTNPKISIVK